MLPDKTFVLKGETCHMSKQSKERLTMLVGANMDGTEKLPLLEIGKPRKPQCFSNTKTFPCKYINNKSAWMTSAIFEGYVRALDAKMVCNNRKILLFMDHCPARPVISNLRNIKIEFLPPNSTSVLQPMDQGVIKILKHQFHKHFVSRLITRMVNGKTSVHKINILDAMHYFAAVWDTMESKSIENCFKKAGFGNFPTELQEINCVTPGTSACNSWNILQEQLNVSCSFEDYVSADDADKKP
ncbi:hypothetical protein PR048_002500 [Dryococelus australis]|uniref:DDE-1 domain-containing protein n=1 Tax=Dryococelus australis TaxID=614101 RepID=A0ABQ9IKE1_9NEOP|nr:hypothetical protein PR048_002500 [Dryococelus australis]